jgi:8-oxo-dGTP pyrophosphatase MutT (NUDIX family)
MDDDQVQGIATPRLAVRVLLIDSAGRTLLFQGGDPARPEDGTWWFTPGGGVEGSETLPEAALREVREETGVVLTHLDDPVHQRRVRFRFQDKLYDQVEHIFVVRVDLPAVDVSGWTEGERRTVVDYRWWTVSELRSTVETVYPEELADLLAAAVATL